MNPQGQPIFSGTPPAQSRSTVPASSNHFYATPTRPAKSKKTFIIGGIIAIIVVIVIVVLILAIPKGGAGSNSAFAKSFYHYANYVVSGTSEEGALSDDYSSKKTYQAETALFYTNEKDKAKTDEYFAKLQTEFSNFKSSYENSKDSLDSDLQKMIERNLVLSNFAINYYKTSQTTLDDIVKKYASSSLDDTIKSIKDLYTPFTDSGFDEGVQYGSIMTEYYETMLTNLSHHAEQKCFKQGITGMAKLCPNSITDFSAEEAATTANAESAKEGMALLAQKNISALSENCFAISKYLATGAKK